MFSRKSTGLVFFTFFLGVLLFNLGSCGRREIQDQSLNHAHNIVLFVADGLRHEAVTKERAPNLFELMTTGVRFNNSHSLLPTLTLANASVISTGHFIGDTGVFANALFTGFPVQSAHLSEIPFMENDRILDELDSHYSVTGGDTLLTAARKAGFAVASVGKLGPALMQVLPDKKLPELILLDDLTGSAQGLPLPTNLAAVFKRAHLPIVTPPRGDNARAGNKDEPGTLVPNVAQQKYFVEATTKAILPQLKSSGRPFILVYWSRDPDGSQHNQGDSLNRLIPGIGGPTSLAGIKNADDNLGSIRKALYELGLESTTNIVVTSDHGFSVISKESKTSFSASETYPDVVPKLLPPGFLAVDLAHALDLKIYDPDHDHREVTPTRGEHPSHALLGKNSRDWEVAVAANGGSDLIYLLGDAKNSKMAAKVAEFLLTQDYVSGIFVDEALGSPPGTLPFDAIGLKGTSRSIRPSFVVSFRSFSTGCGNPTWCGAIVADTFMQQGQGNHGSFGRADTFNFMAAWGPDFKTKFSDDLPVSNADIANTVQHLLSIPRTHEGTRVGRVLYEILPADAATALGLQSQRGTLRSAAAANGLQTVVDYQTVRGTKYFDAAGFPGRTLGLR
jgi:hypothetical protein